MTHYDHVPQGAAQLPSVHPKNAPKMLPLVLFASATFLRVELFFLQDQTISYYR